jgi:GWxTD domain-containing protein
LQEFYYEIAFAQLAFRQAAPGFQSEFKTSVTIADTTGNVVVQDEWLRTVSAGSLEETAGRTLPNQFELALRPGHYTISLILADQYSQKQGAAQLRFQAKNFSGEQLALSDLQFAGGIRADTAQGQFSKNGLQVVPQANTTFSPAMPLLYFYFEAYNLAAADSYEVHYAVKDSRGQIVRALPRKLARQPGRSSVEVGGVHIGALPDSIGWLTVEVKDRAVAASLRRAAGATASAEKKFHLVKAKPVEAFVDAELEAMSEQDFKQHMEQMRYLLSDEDRSALKSLEIPARKRYVSRLWRGLDPQPETPQNEFREEYFKRVRYAEERLTAGFSPGWKTDRGRIAIKFGIPNEVEVERHPVEVSARPYEVWIYYQEGKKQFIFADLEGLGRYELIYSSDERELTRPDWKAIIGAK